MVIYSQKTNTNFYAWQPSTWPNPPETYNVEFRDILESIFRTSMLDEIGNVISDAEEANHGLEHRGHVVALAILCAIDTLSSYAFKTRRISRRYRQYIENFFPKDYRPHAEKIYKLYRNPITHSWNLFQAGMLPGDECIKEEHGNIIFGLKNIFSALNDSVDNFLERLDAEEGIQTSALKRYRKLRNSAIAP